MSDLRPGLPGCEDAAEEVRAPPALRVPSFSPDASASQRRAGGRGSRSGMRPAQGLAYARFTLPEPVSPEAQGLAPLRRAARAGPRALRLRIVGPGLPAAGERTRGFGQTQRRAQHAGLLRQRLAGRRLVRPRSSARCDSREAEGIAGTRSHAGLQRNTGLAIVRCSPIPRKIMSDTGLAFESIASLAGRIGSGSLSPVKCVEELLGRIDALDDRLRSFIRVMPEQALAQARAAEIALNNGANLGILHGLPYAAKDLFDVKGVPTTAGTHLLAHNVAVQDSTVVRKLIGAGMVLLGKTHTVQFAYGAAGINHDYGTPHNPWHSIPHAPGGSSSGSAVAVAAGLVPMALGTDTGGSVRVPAALCGIVGLKTTVGRVSRAGVYPLSWTLDSVGPITRSVEDAALVYQAMQGTDTRDESTEGVASHDTLARSERRGERAPDRVRRDDPLRQHGA